VALDCYERICKKGYTGEYTPKGKEDEKDVVSENPEKPCLDDNSKRYQL